MTAAIYCRLSEEDRNKLSETEDSESIQNQKSMLLRYALDQNWEVYHIYSDDDYTGSDRKRPAFNQLLEDAKAHKFEIILCKTQSRFTRELELVEKYIHGLFPAWGIRFVSIVDNADTANRGNKKARQINGLINEWYLEDMSENIKSVLTDKRKKGAHIGAFALYGYRKDPEQKGHLLIDEEAAAVVREIFTLFSEGYGKTAIARRLNDFGIPNPTEYKRLKGLRYCQPKGKNSTLWNYFAVADMLKNEMYIGNMVQGKYESVSYKTKKNRPRPEEDWYRVENTHEPIIDRELWNTVQAMLKERTKPFAHGKVGLFAGKARCACCGYAMRSSKSRDRYYLKCPSRPRSKDACIGSFLSVEKLEQTVLAELNRLAEEYLDRELLEQQLVMGSSLSEEKEGLLEEAAVYQKKIGEYTKGLRELYFDKVKGMVSVEEYLAFSNEFADEKGRLERAYGEIKRRIADLEEKTAEKDNGRPWVETYTRLEFLNRTVVEKLIDYISIGKRIPGTMEVPVVIHWNF